MRLYIIEQLHINFVILYKVSISAGYIDEMQNKINNMKETLFFTIYCTLLDLCVLHKEENSLLID